ncbi:hypothetical protein N8491_02275 [Akkermansiaceae bacterium]|nr:hypothetical protein [Akkermansiaceae bacterium]MDB4695329.1 hypothetical protein [Akkermansiaceae bacterium]
MIKKYNLYNEALGVLRNMKHEYVLVRYLHECSCQEKELDIIVPARTKHKFARSLKESLPDGISVLSETAGNLGHRVVLVENAAPSFPCLALDIREVVIKKDLVLSDYEALVGGEEITEQNGLPCLGYSCEIAFLIARNYWSERAPSERHLAIARRCQSLADIDRVKSLLKSLFLVEIREDDDGEDTGTSFVELLKEQNRLIGKSVPGSRKFSRLSVKFQLFYKHGLFSLVSFRRRPTIVVIYGPDGAGKSTAAYELSLLFDGAQVITTHGGRKEIDGEYMKQQRDLAAATLDNKNSLVQNKKGNFIYVIYRAILIVPKHLWFYLDVRKRASADVIVYDRFGYDHLFKGATWHLPVSLKMFLLLACRPLRMKKHTHHLLLCADFDVLNSRKKEISKCQSEQYYSLEKFYFGLSIKRIDATESSKNVTKLIVNEILF